MNKQQIILVGLFMSIFILGVILLRDVLSFSSLEAYRSELLAFRDDNFVLMALSFVTLYTLISAFSLPGALVASITGGFLFGLYIGSLLNVASASLGAVALFLALQRGFGQSLVDRMTQGRARPQEIMQKLRENEFGILLFLRFVPVFPFVLVNLMAALSGVKLRNFVVTTVIGIFPGAVVFTSIGVGLGVVFDNGERPDISLIWSPSIFLPLLGLGMLSLLPVIFNFKKTG